MEVLETRRDYNAVDTDSDCNQHRQQGCNRQADAAAVAAAAVEAEDVSSSEGYRQAAEASQRMNPQKWCFAVTGNHPGTHIHSVLAARRHLLLKDTGWCTWPGQHSHTAAAAAAVVLAQLAVDVHTAHSVLAGHKDFDTRIAVKAAAGTARFDSTTCSLS